MSVCFNCKREMSNTFSFCEYCGAYKGNSKEEIKKTKSEKFQEWKTKKREHPELNLRNRKGAGIIPSLKSFLVKGQPVYILLGWNTLFGGLCDLILSRGKYCPDSIQDAGEGVWVYIDQVSSNGDITFSEVPSEKWNSLYDFVRCGVKIIVGYIAEVTKSICIVQCAPKVSVNVKITEVEAGILKNEIGMPIALTIVNSEDGIPQFEIMEMAHIDSFQYSLIKENRDISFKERMNREGLPPDFFIPGKTGIITRGIRDDLISISGWSDADVDSQLEDDYANAASNGALINDGDGIWAFKTSFSQDGAAGFAPIYVSIAEHRDDNTGKWITISSGFRSKGMKKVLETEVYAGNWYSEYHKLKKMAAPEYWGENDRTLISKLAFSYHGASFQDKIKKAKGSDINRYLFNTGFVNPVGKEIYGVLSKPSPADISDLDKAYIYKWEGFAIPGQGSRYESLGKEIVSYFDTFPPKADFAIGINADDLQFDANASIFLDEDHILIDNVNRLPIEFIEDSWESSEDGVRARLATCKKDEDYDWIREKIEADIGLKSRLYKKLQEAAEYSIKRCSEHPEDVVVTYFPSGNTADLVIPLVLDDRKDKDHDGDVGLVISKQPSGNYQGETILTTDMVYNSAYIIRKVAAQWVYKGLEKGENLKCQMAF